MMRSGWIETVTDLGVSYEIRAHTDPLMGFTYRFPHPIPACRILVITPDKSFFTCTLMISAQVLRPGDLVTWVEGPPPAAAHPSWEGAVMVELQSLDVDVDGGQPYLFVKHIDPIRPLKG